MKKRWIPVIILTLAVTLLIGVVLGMDMERQGVLDDNVARADFPATIAVVNSDTGVVVDGENLNYSAEIIGTLGDGFTLVSPAMAYNGLVEGIYRAILTFPSNVSERIVAFNTGHPERVQLEFRVSSDLPESDYIMTHIELLNLQLTINTVLANTYVSSLFSQFHIAQDQMGAVFLNNVLNRDALEIVYLRDFTPDLELDFLPEVPFEPNEVDTSEHFISVEDFAIQVSETFSSNFELAAEIYIDMRDLIDELVEDVLPVEREEWVGDANEWVASWVGFAIGAEKHIGCMETHQSEQLFWHTELAVPHHAALGAWQFGLDSWYIALNDWYANEAGIWYAGVGAEVTAVNSEILALNGLWTNFNISGWNDVMIQVGNRPNFDNFPCECDPDIYCDYNCNGTGCACDPADCSTSCLADRMSAYNAALDAWALAVTVPMQSAIAASPLFMAEWVAGFQEFNLNLQPISDLPSIPSSYDMAPATPVIPVMIELEPPPIWDPEHPMPETPDRDEPPEPDDLWNSIYYNIYSALGTFTIGEFMTPELWDHVDSLLGAYYAYLEFIRQDLSFQFMENVFMLFDVRLEYIEYLSELRVAAFESEYEVRAYLQDTLDEFFTTVYDSGQDTYGRLGEFSGMLPESRTETGINQNLVDFTIAPFEFITPAIREGVDADPGAISIFEILLWIAIAILAIFVILAVTLTTIEIVKKTKAERNV